jgi:hypothetical protein
MGNSGNDQISQDKNKRKKILTINPKLAINFLMKILKAIPNLSISGIFNIQYNQ